MNVYTFYDNAQEMHINISAEEELDAWADLADNFGACYVMDNIQYVGKNIF